jgi:hypothetical protein
VNEAEVIDRTEVLPDRYADWVRPEDLDGMRSMADGGEWQELVDLLIASVALPQTRLSLTNVTNRGLLERRVQVIVVLQNVITGVRGQYGPDGRWRVRWARQY